ncbi:MAG: TrkA family potassium uptake protein [Chloroflexota bacterium]
MNIVIVGCGRVGATLAADLDSRGNQVTIIDLSTGAFERLPSTFGGEAIRGDGTDEDTLRRAGAASADVFLAMTEGDNRNVMAAQLATEALGVQKVVAKINDTVRARAYADLGVATICRTDLMAHALLAHVGLPVGPAPGVRNAAPHPHHDEPLGPAGAAAPVAAVGARPAGEG